MLAGVADDAMVKVRCHGPFRKSFSIGMVLRVCGSEIDGHRQSDRGEEQGHDGGQGRRAAEGHFAAMPRLNQAYVTP
jgi:hypothetical protein